MPYSSLCKRLWDMFRCDTYITFQAARDSLLPVPTSSVSYHRNEKVAACKDLSMHLCIPIINIRSYLWSNPADRRRSRVTPTEASPRDLQKPRHFYDREAQPLSFFSGRTTGCTEVEEATRRGFRRNQSSHRTLHLLWQSRIPWRVHTQSCDELVSSGVREEQRPRPKPVGNPPHKPAGLPRSPL